jgi:hypothetical protein
VVNVKTIIFAVLFAFTCVACGGDKPPMVPDPDNSTSTNASDAGAQTD